MDMSKLKPPKEPPKKSIRGFLNRIAPWTEEFFFFQPEGTRLVICNPQGAICESPTFLHSERSLEEHIRIVQEKPVKEAMIVATDIGFLTQCSELEDLWVIPSFEAHDFDCSPLYDMPNLRSLDMHTIYGENDEYVAHIDYSRIPRLERLVVSAPKGHHNVHCLKQLKSLYIGEKQPASKTLVGFFDGEELEELTLGVSTVSTLDGLEQAKKLCRLRLAFNLRLTDISALACVKDTLTELEIQNCGKIKDFSVLSQLHRLECLRMLGTNVIPDVAFLRSMPNLKKFVFTMNAADGDMSACLNIPNVYIQNRRHYSHKNTDFSTQGDGSSVF